MLLFTAFPAAAQMKFGGGPFLRNDAILELSSGRKGLLLPRVSSTALSAKPLDTAAAGMLIFNTSDQNLYIKKNDGNTPWTRVNDGGTALSAADIVPGSVNYIQNQVLSPQAAGFRINGPGTVKSLNVADMAVNGGLLLTDNTGNVIQKTGQLVWDADNELGIGTGAPTAKLDVNGNFKLGASGTVLMNVCKTSAVSASLTIDNGATAAVVLTLSGIASLKLTDNVIVNPAGTVADGLIMSHAKVTDAVNKRVSVYFTNPATVLGPSRTLAAQTFYVTVIQN